MRNKGSKAIIILVIVAILCLLFCKKTDCPQWRGVIPGSTTYYQVILRFGAPDEIEEERNYIALRYNPTGYSSCSYEFWIRGTQLDNGLVEAIVLSDHCFDPPNNFSQLINNYGRAEKVTWSYRKNWRYLLWPQKGVAAFAKSERISYEEEMPSVDAIFFFKPLSLDEFLESAAYWPFYPSYAIAPENIYCIGCSSNPDRQPEDSYAWEYWLGNAPDPLIGQRINRFGQYIKFSGLIFGFYLLDISPPPPSPKTSPTLTSYSYEKQPTGHYSCLFA